MNLQLTQNYGIFLEFIFFKLAHKHQMSGSFKLTVLFRFMCCKSLRIDDLGKC